MIQSASSSILAMQPLDEVQYAALRTSFLLFVNNGMMEEAGYGLDWLSAAEQFSHAVSVSKNLIFCTT